MGNRDLHTLRIEALPFSAWDLDPAIKDLLQRLSALIPAQLSGEWRQYEQPLPDQYSFRHLTELAAWLYAEHQIELKFDLADLKNIYDSLNGPPTDPEPPQPVPDNAWNKDPTGHLRWVNVIGTGQYKLGPDLVSVSEAVGKLLAQEGYGLITGGMRGVDNLCSNAFSDELASQKIPDTERLLRLLTRGQKSDYTRGAEYVVDSDDDWFDFAVKHAFAVILIGGNGGGSRAFTAARANGTPVIPIPFTGGDAGKAYQEMMNSDHAAYPLELIRPETFNFFKLSPLDPDPKTPSAQFYYPLSFILGLVGGNPQPPLAGQQFQKVAEDIYRARPVTVPDDLQKNRWGGQTSAKNFALTASVGARDAEGNFQLNIVVEDTGSPRRPDAEVAIFLHNTFDNEIEYEPLLKGKAVLTVKTYEAFTIGAFLNDGTQLELDLNKEIGYPPDFYYHDEPGSFRQRVEALLGDRPVTVKDDQQKNRWGGRSIRNGKELSATVKRSFIPGFYNVTLQIAQEGQARPIAPLTGQVAFFLHTTFLRPVIYRLFTGGIARITVKAYEAFTVGAYTEDGVFLELDLQQVKGFPTDFYYKSSNTSGKLK
jgi:hypothetical protein